MPVSSVLPAKIIESKGARVPPAPSALAPVTADELADVAQLWNRVEQACGGNRRLEVLVGEMKLDRFESGTATFSVNSKLMGAAQSNVAEFTAAVKTAIGQSVTVMFEPTQVEEEPSTSLTPRTNMQEHALVLLAIKLLGARVINVQPRVKPAE